MSYTINPNAKNRWARNAENTMDLSLETDASSVYLDNGRTLEQEIGEGSMVSNVITVDSSMSKVIDGTLDGAYESGVMYGRSLVNLVSNHKIEIANGGTNSFPMTIPMDVGKKYLISFKIDTAHTSTGESNQSAIKLQYYSSTDSKGYNFIYNSELADGREFKFIVEPFSGEVNQNTNFFAIWLTRYESGTLRGKLSVFEYVDGMENWDIPYFTGLCDVKMPILRNTGKNLFDGNLELGTISSSNGVITPSTTRVRSLEYLMVNSNTTYTLSNDLNYANDIIYEYDENLDYIGRKSSATFTTSTNCKYIKFSTKEGECDLSVKYQLEEGSAATEHKPHKINILRTSEEIVLREVGGVQDTYNLLTGEYVRRIEEIVLDGSENWTIHNNDHSNRIVFKTSSKLSGYNTTTSIADKIRTSKIAGGISDFFGYSFLRIGENTATPTAGVFLHLEGELASMSNVAKLTEWLQANPITVQYELKTPITTIIESLTTPFAYQNGHVILESGYEGQSLLPTLEYSTVVNKTGLVENVAKTIQRQEKQLTMLEKMLIQNIINLDYNNTLLTLKNEMEEML